MKSKPVLLGVLCGFSVSVAQWDVMPAARKHVRQAFGGYYLYTSKLSHVAELNFTFGFDHPAGKTAISEALKRIAQSYGIDSVDAYRISRFVGPQSGSGPGLPTPAFTPADLETAQVLVLNNISAMDLLPSKDSALAQTLEQSMAAGKGVLGFHGSSDGGAQWDFYSKVLFPWVYHGHSFSSTLFTYLNEKEKAHLVLEGLFTSATRPFAVPVGMDGDGKEILKDGVPARMVNNEVSRYAVNALRDSTFSASPICPILFDPERANFTYLPRAYRFVGGNAFSCIWKKDHGKVAYFPQGHDLEEMKQGPLSFDQGSGDLDRYLGQMLFFLAGYKIQSCSGTACNGLPLVDSLDHLTGGYYQDGQIVSGLFRRIPRPLMKRIEAKVFNALGRHMPEPDRVWRHSPTFGD